MRAILLANPASGKQKLDKTINICKKRFLEKGYHLDIYFSNRAGDLSDKAELWASDYDIYLICGGDGTVNEVINGIMKSDVRPNLAILPAGTVNDTAKILGFTKNINKNLDIILNTDPVEMDINKINDKYFAYVAGAGYLTEISYMAEKEEKKKYGSLAYLKTGIKGLRKKPYFRARIEVNGETFEQDVSLILILAANQFGGLRLWRFSRRTKLNDGLVDLRTFTGRKWILIFRLILFVIFAGRKQFKQKHYSTNKAKITPLDNADIIWNADGEKASRGTIEISVIPKAVSVYVSSRRRKKLF